MTNNTAQKRARTIDGNFDKLQKRVESHKKEREILGVHLDEVIKHATNLKREIGLGIDNRSAGNKAKRKLSPEARERIANAARKRWAAYRKNKS